MVHKKSERGLAGIVLVAFLGIIIILAGVGYLLVKKPKPETLKPTPIPTATPTATPTPSPNANANGTADWTTYRNEEYEFEVKYPQNWTIDNPNNWKGYVEFHKQSSDQQDGFSITFYKDISEFRSADFNSLEDYYNYSPFVEKKEIISIGGKKFQKLSVHECPRAMHMCTQLFIEKDSHIYKIEHEFENEIINKILSTFRFIE